MARRWWAGKPALAGAALLAGISGLGLEILIVTLCGLTLGYGSSGPVGITTFIVGWALGARWSGAMRFAPRRVLLVTGVFLLVAAAITPRLLLAVGATAPGSPLAWIVSLGALLVVAVPQGIFLPQLVRGWELKARGDLGVLFAANLAGAAIGALWIGHHLPALLGRPAAAAIAGAIALLAAGLGALGVGRNAASAEEAADPAPEPDAEHLAPVHAGAILAVCIGWLGTLEWIGLRLGVLWLGGMQEALTGVLLASMIALGIGAWLGPRVLGRSLESLVRLLVICSVASLSFLYLPLFLDRAGELPLVVRSLLLVGPALLPFGALVPILHRHTAGPGAARLGRLLLFEALGALFGLPISYVLLVPALGIGGTIVFWLLAPAASIVVLVPRLRLRAAWGLVAVGAVALVADSSRTPPALDSPPLSNSALEVLDFAEDEHFAVTVVRDGLAGETTLMTDGFRAAGTGPAYRYMRVLGHLPLLLHEDPKSVAVLALGTGTTAGAVSLHPEVESIDVLELSRAVTDRARWFESVNLGVLEDRERVTVRLGDGRRTLPGRPTYDVVTMEPLLPDSPFGVYLYTEEFYQRARRSLTPGGLLCQWVPPHALEPETFEAVVAAFHAAFEWSGVWLSGTQLILVGGDERPLLRASRFPDDGGVLHRALDELGLESPEGLLARYVVGGSSWPAAERPLTDGDPWIVYRPQRRGVELLTDLPRNLRTLRRLSEPIPTEWWVGLGEGAPARFDALARLREAREAFAVEEVEARGFAMPDPDLRRGGSRFLARAEQLAPSDGEVIALERERRFLENLRGGVLLLMRSPSAESARAAAARLEKALTARPQRGDVTLYLGVALYRLGDARAGEVLAEALERCPRIAETDAGERALQLGLPPALLEPGE